MQKSMAFQNVFTVSHLPRPPGNQHQVRFRSRIQIPTSISRLKYFALRVVRVLEVLSYCRIFDIGLFGVVSSHIE